jgi:hypothetical protein
MSDLDDISSKIRNILETYYGGEESIICDNGQSNVYMVNGNPRQFDFVDSNEVSQRTDIEDDKIRFLNDVMEIFFDVQRYVSITDSIEILRNESEMEDNSEENAVDTMMEDMSIS